MGSRSAGPLSVVIVTGDPEEAQALTAALEAGGYDVRATCVPDLAGLDAALDPAVDVVVADFGTEGLDVGEVLAHVRAGGSGTPLVVVSGPVATSVAVHHVTAGVSDWVLENERDRLPAAVGQAMARGGAFDDRHGPDATAPRTWENQLRDAEERFRLAFDEAPIGVALVALDGRWLRVNKELCDIVGYTQEELLQRSFQDITHPDDLSADMAYVRRLLAGEIQTNQIEKRYFHADGHIVWIQLNVSLARDERGDPLYFVNQVQDITGRKATEERIRGSEERFRSLLESAPDAMVIAGADGRIVLVNRQTEQMFGFARDELVGQPVETLIPPQFRERHASHRSGFAHGPQARPMGAGLELFGVRRDGTEFPVEISLSPLETEEGLLVSAAVRDITERKRAESIVLSALKRERELTERLRELDRIKSDFVATVSHELRTPLTNIIGTIELLAEGDFGELSAQQRRIVDVLDRNSHRLLDLIKDLLDLNQIEAGGLGLQLAPTDLGQLVDRVRSQMASPADAKRLALGVEVDPELGTAMVDAGQLERALVNLLSNAIKFTPVEGRIAFRAERAGGQVVFVIADTGIGIPEQEKEHLFTRFFRSSIATEKAIPGSGLGLVIVKSIVEGHGGTVTIDSVVGEGTTVTVSLPLRQPVEPAAPLAPVAV